MSETGGKGTEERGERGVKEVRRMITEEVMGGGGGTMIKKQDAAGLS